MKRILIIEHESVLRMTFRHFLEERGYEVIEAANGEAGLKACHAFRPHVVITNVNSTVKTAGGRYVVEALRSEFHDIPIISVSGSLAPSSEEDALGLGASMHMTKPIDAAELVANVDRLTGARKPTDIAKVGVADLK